MRLLTPRKPELRAPSRNLLYHDPDLGWVRAPEILDRRISLPGRPTKPIVTLGEIGIVVAKQHRPVYDERGRILRMELVWHSITHNGRNQYGAGAEANRVRGTGTGATVQAPAGPFNVHAISNLPTQSSTQANGDKSICSATQGVSTNEFTGNGLARVTGTATFANYTAPGAFSGQYTQVLSSGALTVSSGPVTAYGGALFDSTTVAGSVMDCEDAYAASAVLQTNDTLTQNWTVQD